MALHYLELAEVSHRIRNKELKPSDLTAYVLNRIAKHDAELHSYYSVLDERARQRACQADDEIARGFWRGPLHGVPIAIKDVLDTDFAPTSVGMSFRKDYIPPKNATVVDRLERAGAVILGKLATTEGIFVTHHPDFQTPLNPRGEKQWTGVSSSGSGVATAAGLCFGSLGTDTGGSVRLPSSINGLTGIKPSWGRVSRAGLFPLSPTFDHVGPMTRSARDAAVLLSAIAGWDPADPTSLSVPAADYGNRLAASVAGVRVGVDEKYIGDNVDPEVTAAVMAAVADLEALGARIVPVQIPAWGKIVDGWNIICGSEAAIAHRDTYPSQASRYGPELAHLIDIGLNASGCDLAQALLDRQEFIGQMIALFDTIDVLATPTMAIAVPEAKTVANLLGDESVDLGRYTIPPNVTGQPAISFPAGFDRSGHPIGLQLTGRHLAEQQLLDAAHAFQSVTDWHLRHPTL